MQQGQIQEIETDLEMFFRDTFEKPAEPGDHSVSVFLHEVDDDARKIEFEACVEIQSDEDISFDIAEMNKAISRLSGVCDLFLLQPAIMPYVEIFNSGDAADSKRRGTLSFYVQVTPLADYHKSLIISNEDWQLGAFELRDKLSTEE